MRIAPPMKIDSATKAKVDERGKRPVRALGDCASTESAASLSIAGLSRDGQGAQLTRPGIRTGNDPPGVSHDGHRCGTSLHAMDLWMNEHRRLTGRQAARPANRFLVIVRAGDESLHPQWTDSLATRGWDLAVSYFGTDAE